MLESIFLERRKIEYSNFFSSQKHNQMNFIYLALSADVLLEANLFFSISYYVLASWLLYFVNEQLGAGATPPLSPFCTTALKGWATPSSLDSLQQTQHFPFHVVSAYGNGAPHGKPEEERNKPGWFNM